MPFGLSHLTEIFSSIASIRILRRDLVYTAPHTTASPADSSLHLIHESLLDRHRGCVQRSTELIFLGKDISSSSAINRIFFGIKMIRISQRGFNRIFLRITFFSAAFNRILLRSVRIIMLPLSTGYLSGTYWLLQHSTYQNLLQVFAQCSANFHSRIWFIQHRDQHDRIWQSHCQQTKSCSST